MPPLPPTELVLEKLHQLVVPAAGAAALIVCLFLLLGRWAAALGAAAAVVVAFLTANFTLANIPFGEKPTWENTYRLIVWKPVDKPENPAPGWHWLPRAGLVLVVVGLLSRWAGLLASRLLAERWCWVANVIVWLPRITAVYIVSGWLASGTAAARWPELGYELPVVMLAIWVALDGVARAEAGPQVAAYLSIMLMAGATLLIYAHSAKFMDIAVILGSAMFGIAVAARIGKADTSGAIPAGVAFLPGLILGGRPSLGEHQVPAACFWLVALTPVVLLPFLIPVLSRTKHWLVPTARAILVLAPIIIAVVLAAQHEKLAFEEEW